MSIVLLGGFASRVGAAPHTPADSRVSDVSLRDSLWASRYGPGIGFDVARALEVSHDGSKVFITGSSYGATGAYDFATVAYDAATGTELWAARYDGPGHDWDIAYGLGVSPDGSMVFVTGSSSGLGFSNDYATVAYDAETGSEVWAARYNGPGDQSDDAYGLVVGPDGSMVFVTGWSIGSNGLSDYATIAYDAASGTSLWTSRYDGAAKSADGAAAVTVSPRGSMVFVTGFSFGPGSASDYATVAYDAVAGAEVWTSRYDGPGNCDDSAKQLGVSPDGSSLFVTGDSCGSGTGIDFGTIAYDAATGLELWASLYNGPPRSGSDNATALGVSPDGSAVFVAGPSHGPAFVTDYATVAHDAVTGAELWASRYNGPAKESDNATALGVSPDASSVFVTGTSHRPSTSDEFGGDYATVAFDAATGTKLWAARAGRQNDDGATALGVSPDGSVVFVTGYLEVSISTAKFGTVAYSF